MRTGATARPGGGTGRCVRPAASRNRQPRRCTPVGDRNGRGGRATPRRRRSRNDPPARRRPRRAEGIPKRLRALSAMDPDCLLRPVRCGARGCRRSVAAARRGNPRDLARSCSRRCRDVTVVVLGAWPGEARAWGVVPPDACNRGDGCGGTRACRARPGGWAGGAGGASGPRPGVRGGAAGPRPDRRLFPPGGKPGLPGLSHPPDAPRLRRPARHGPPGRGMASCPAAATAAATHRRRTDSRPRRCEPRRTSSSARKGQGAAGSSRHRDPDEHREQECFRTCGRPAAPTPRPARCGRPLLGVRGFRIRTS